MKQADLNRAVARVTGETVSEIERLGFNLLVVPRLIHRSWRRSCRDRRPRIFRPCAAPGPA